MCNGHMWPLDDVCKVRASSRPHNEFMKILTKKIAKIGENLALYWKFTHEPIWVIYNSLYIASCAH